MRDLVFLNRSSRPWITIAIVATMAQSVYGVTPESHSAEMRELLELVPQNTVSVFCIDTPFTLMQWDDLTKASVFESAICFTTMLVQHEPDLGLNERKVCCAVSAIRDIREPKQNSTTPILNGSFQSQRCELLLVPKKLPSDWFIVVAKRFNAKVLKIAGHSVMEVPVANEKLLVVRLTDNTICVANHSGFLTEVLRLANANGRQRVASIGRNPVFQIAMSCITPQAKFWGIRLFIPDTDAKDPTSIRNTESFVGFHDPKAIFVTLELARIESLDVQFHYASEDTVGAAKLLPEYLEKAVRVTRGDGRPISPSDYAGAKFVVTSMVADLTRWKIAGMEEPSVLFLGFCTMFGQGMLL